MQKLLNQLLVLVDFSDSCKTGLNNLVPLANEMMCDLHILHVVQGHDINGDKVAEANNLLQHWQSHYLRQLRNGLLVYSKCVKGNPEKQIREYANKNSIDLVILMEHSRYAWSNFFTRINIDQLAGKLNCPVLNLPSPETVHAFRNIVMPVTDMLPLRKMLFATYIARYHQADIHLVSLQQELDNYNQSGSNFLMRTFQLLKENTNLHIECHPAEGSNIADTTLTCAKKVKADLIVVEAGKETVLPGLMNTIFSRFLFSGSSIPVMAV